MIRFQKPDETNYDAYISDLLVLFGSVIILSLIMPWNVWYLVIVYYAVWGVSLGIYVWLRQTNRMIYKWEINRIVTDMKKTN